MDPKELFRQSLSEATAAIKKVRTDQCALPTPCSDWDINDLMNHMLYELAWIPELLAGKTVAEIGDKYEGAVGGKHPEAVWDKYAKKALKAVEDADLGAVVHLSYSDVEARHYISEVGSDLLIHTWDLCQGLWHSLWFDVDLTKSVYDFVSPRADEFAASGLFGIPIEVGSDAPLQAKLLGFFGRAGQSEPDDGLN